MKINGMNGVSQQKNTQALSADDVSKAVKAIVK